MRISQIFQLDREQPVLDFVDVDPSRDLALFVDPYLLAMEDGPWALRATETITHFFTHFFALLTDGNEREARTMFTHFHEPNETCLGLSQGRPSGRGIGSGNAGDLFESMSTSQAVNSGLVRDLEDAEVFIKGIGPDKVSDMVTNIIRGLLVEYTQAQCAVWGIPLRPNTPSGFYWVPDRESWVTRRTDMLTLDGERKILLVPKWAVSSRSDSPKDEYHREHLLEFERNEQISLNGLLVQKRKDGTPYVTNADLIDSGHTARKEYLTEWSVTHGQVVESFRARTRPKIALVSQHAWVGPNSSLQDVCEQLQEELRGIPTGANDATRYHRCVAAILDLLFYPELGNIQSEEAIHDGRKRIDVLFDHMDHSGFFHRLQLRHNLHCPYIVVECKNYSKDVTNPELDQLIGRFSDDRGRVGLLLCRTIDNLDLFLQRCRDTFTDRNGLILPLVDSDLHSMLDELAADEEPTRNRPAYEAILDARKRAIILAQ